MKNKLFSLLMTIMSFNSAQASEGQTLLEFFGFSSQTDVAVEVLADYQAAIEQVRTLSSVMTQENVSTDYVERLLVWLNDVASDLQTQSVDVLAAQTRLNKIYTNHLNDLNEEFGVVELAHVEKAPNIFSISDLSEWIGSSAGRIEKAATAGS